MKNKLTYFPLYTGQQSVLLSDLLQASLSGVILEANKKISKFLNILADDILSMRTDTRTLIDIKLTNDEFIIYLYTSYPFLDFLNEMSQYTKKDNLLWGWPVVFNLDLNIPIEKITSYLISDTLDKFKYNGIYAYSVNDHDNSLESFINIDASNTFYAFDVIDKAFDYDGELSKFVRNQVYSVQPYATEDYFLNFDFLDFNSHHIELILYNNDFYIKSTRNNILLEYSKESVNFSLDRKQSIDENVKIFTQNFLNFYNANLDTDHDDLPRWIKLQEMIDI